jgi:hypothetical protein
VGSCHVGPVYPISVGDVAKYTVPPQIPAANEEYLVNKTGVMTSFGFDYIGWTKLPVLNHLFSATKL